MCGYMHMVKYEEIQRNKIQIRVVLPTPGQMGHGARAHLGC